MRCSRCRRDDLSESDFYTGKQGYCKPCARKYKKDTYDPYKRKIREIKLQYNITEEEYLSLTEAGCFCGAKENLVIDHDHKCCPERKRSCGKCVRGTICSNHNLLLGLAGDDTDVLRQAIEYLEVHNDSEGVT